MFETIGKARWIGVTDIHLCQVDGPPGSSIGDYEGLIHLRWKSFLVDLSYGLFFT